MVLLTFELADIGRLAVDAERARRERETAKRAHRAACAAFYEAGGVLYNDEGIHPDYAEATDDLYASRMAASKACTTATRRLRRSVKKYDALIAAARQPQEERHEG